MHGADIAKVMQNVRFERLGIDTVYFEHIGQAPFLPSSTFQEGDDDPMAFSSVLISQLSDVI